MAKRHARRFSNNVKAVNAVVEGMARARELGYSHERDLARFAVHNLRRFGLTLRRMPGLTKDRDLW